MQQRCHRIVAHSIRKKGAQCLREKLWGVSRKRLREFGYFIGEPLSPDNVIVCDGQNFSVDESWRTQVRSEAGLSSNEDAARRSNEPVRQGKDLIESALARSKGKIAGAHGAAETLGMPVSTLNSKLKALKIDKHRFERI
jgi:transcriptional regulator with GAF, ATPase, and Fis domain